jgi:hypothetical protein
MKISPKQSTERIGVQVVGEKFERAGYIFREQPVSDYGIDALIEGVEGENLTGKLVALQIKSGSSYFKESTENEYIYRGSRDHLEYWLKHSLPVLIVLCDTDNSLCFWQAVTPANISYTKKAWKILIPKYQQINSGMYVDLRNLITKFPIYKPYTISSIKDLSHGLAKRYCLRIILNKQHTQSEIVCLIKNLTQEAINTEYHRSDLTRHHWRNISAHVIWLFIFPSTEDENRNNFICQTEWFSCEISPDDLPVSNKGEEISPNLKVCWNNDYTAMAKFNEENTVSKEDFINKVIALTNSAQQLFEFAGSSLMSVEKADFGYKVMREALITKYTEMDEIYKSVTNIGLAPYECKD